MFFLVFRRSSSCGPRDDDAEEVVAQKEQEARVIRRSVSPWIHTAYVYNSPPPLRYPTHCEFTAIPAYIPRIRTVLHSTTPPPPTQYLFYDPKTKRAPGQSLN